VCSVAFCAHVYLRECTELSEQELHEAASEHTREALVIQREREAFAAASAEFRARERELDDAEALWAKNACACSGKSAS
jgi:hypothetical protein